MSKRLLVVGNGMAALKLLEELSARAPGAYRITCVGAEPDAAYNRVLLSSLLAREIGADDARLKPRSWYAAHGIELITGQAVTALDTSCRSARLADGGEIAFDACVLATGSDPIRVPVPGADLDGVVTFRTFADIAAMSRDATAAAVVIGGGPLGNEAAYGLARLGRKVTLLHVMDKLMERQLDAEAAGLLKAALAAKGVDVVLQADTKRIIGETHATGVELKDGRVIPCGLVVFGVGIRPATRLAAAAGLEVKRGIAVDDMLATSAAGIYAIGECAEHRGIAYGLVEPAYEQARALARVLAGEAASYPGSLVATNLKVSGVPVFSAGDFEGVGAECLTVRDTAACTYRKLVVRDRTLAGAVLFGDTADAPWYLDLIRSGADIAHLRADLAFGRAYAEAA